MLTDVVIGIREFVGSAVEGVGAAIVVFIRVSSRVPPTIKVTDSRSRSSSLAEESSRSRRYLLTSVR